MPTFPTKMSTFLSTSPADVEGSDFDKEYIKLDASDAESFYSKDIDDFGTLPLEEYALQVPGSMIPGQLPRLSQPAADGSPPNSLYSSDHKADLLLPSLSSANPFNKLQPARSRSPHLASPLPTLTLRQRVSSTALLTSRQVGSTAESSSCQPNVSARTQLIH